MLRFAALIFALTCAMPAKADCPPSGACIIPDGRYLAYPPPDWDGKTPLAAMVFLHGYNQTPDSYAEPSGWFMQFGAANKVLLVLPEGGAKTWSYLGSPMENRDDAGFIGKVLDNVEARYPVDRKRLWVSGFSQGGSMAWYAACALGDRIAAVAPIAGAFWEPLPANCAKGPVNLIHIHGLADEVVPMKGRPIGERWKQGDVMQSLAVMAGSNGCTSESSTLPATLGTMKECSIRTSLCNGKSKTRITLCLHEGGHSLRRDFLDAAWVFVNQLDK
jgi:polyhydroxybutyrate depolymerase